MKIRNPQTRYNLSIKRSDNVLEVGGGHNPHPRSNIVVDKYAGNQNLHRGLDLKVLPNQQFIEADGESLPFPDKKFDYVICNHVLEHVDDPAKFLKEQIRVGKRGYIETPSFIGEYLIPKTSHKWVILEIDQKLILYDKDVINFRRDFDLGFIFNEYLPKHSIGYKLLQRTQSNLITVNYEWSESIEFLVNPPDTYYRSFFTNLWDEEFCRKILPQRSLRKEASITWKAFKDVCRSVFQSKVLH